jgi:hypothetical protein
MITETMKEVCAWIDWKEKCDIQKCSKENRDILNCYGDKTLKWHLTKFSYSNLNASEFMPGYAFAIFERHAVNKKYVKNDDKKGKTYKEGLFYIAGKDVENNIGLLKRYFQLYLRDGIRHYYSEDIKTNTDKEISLNNTLKNNESDSVEYIDLLPETLILEDEVSKEELFNIAKKYAEKIFEEMSFNHKAIILAISLDLSYSTSKALQEVTGMSKSTLGDHYQKITYKKHYIDIIKKDFPNENAEIIVELYGLSVSMIAGKRIISWGKSEIRCEPLFKESESDFVKGGKL